MYGIIVFLMATLSSTSASLEQIGKKFFSDIFSDIIKKFQYTTEIPLSAMEDQWKEKLGIEIHPGGGDTGVSFMVVPPIEIIATKILALAEEEYIYTDCRFFALLIGNLQEVGLGEKSVFIMVSKRTPIEPMIPETCAYLSLDTDIFVHNKETDDPIILSTVLRDNQGQWIVKIKHLDMFLGIVSEGPILLSLADWNKKYQENVTQTLKTIEPKNGIEISMIGILKILVEKHGVQVGVYKFNQRGNVYNELKTPKGSEMLL